ncbi:fructosamine kinase family protein [Nocardia sp. NPDC052254]|uniref:fructosamine kinase family protein n=1 Tax=Nocardia sp. NPDC052254 TaxID=3155681 RepID=UPI00342429E2
MSASGDLASDVSRLLGGTAVTAAAPAGRGHAWTLYRARLADGRDIFVKRALGEHDSATTAILHAEAEGLRWLRAAATDLVPPVLAADDHTLILPWLTPIEPTRAAAERLGIALAGLHSHATDAYGAPWGGWIATLPQDNSRVTGEWGRWYARHRLQPLLPAAAPVLGRAGVRLFEQVVDRIDDLAGPPEPPSRIHGDLWSGNLMWTRDGVLIIDPAAHGGHRETDLAMLRLFGVPGLDRILGAYGECFPLSPGFEHRVALHQLYPLLVHVVLFGGGYRDQAVDAAGRALAS